MRMSAQHTDLNLQERAIPLHTDDTSAPLASWYEAHAVLISTFTTIDSAPEHARLSVATPHGDHPLMFWHGISGSTGREILHFASPIRVSEANLRKIATDIAEFPVGGLRVLGTYPHIHEALPVGVYSQANLVALVKLLATQAASLEKEVTA